MPEYVYYILKLPKIKSLNIISHGFNTIRLLSSVEAIYAMCKKNGVSFHISISLDGFGKVHDEVRRIPKGFYKTMHTINTIRENKRLYCDSFDVGCTVVKQNIDWINQLKVFAKKEKLDIKFRLGIENKRIESDQLVDQFSVIYSDFRQLAKEFFYSLMLEAKTLNDKYKYYCIFDWLNSSKPKRKLGCMWQDEGVTLDSRGDVYYCAVASDKIGSLRERNGEEIFFSRDSINYRKSIIQNNCDNCIHDYVGVPMLKNKIQFIFFILKNQYYNVVAQT